jgi:uncharacterized protein YmfQ (DUF2313 family)
VLGLLPPGPVWEGAQVEGTVQNSYWRAYASVIAFTYGRLCDFVDEFFCHSVKESLDQWIEEYGLDDNCDPYGHNLCVKVAAQGGATCDYFTQISTLSGWSITCTDTSKLPEPIAGCFEVGCTPLGPEPVYNPIGSRLGYGQRGACAYDQVVDHPDPGKWENGHTAGAICPVPGSNLGSGPDTDESCCFIVGFYDFVSPDAVVANDYCQTRSETIYFDCPRTDLRPDTTPCPVHPDINRFDDTGNYTDWGQAYTWEVEVDIGASQALQSENAPPPIPTHTISAAGNFMAGTSLFSTDDAPSGTPLCFDSPIGVQSTFVLCFLERVKPAHTTLNVKVIQPS